MEEATGAPSSFADCDPRRPRASGRGGGAVMTRPPSPLTMLLSRHTRRAMRWREFISLLGGALVAGPLAARAQQGVLPMIGYLSAGAPESGTSTLAAFRKGLSEIGLVEGRNVSIEYR